MYYFLSIVGVILSFLLVVVVLLQSSKGGGLAGITGGAGDMGSMFGSRRTADFLSKATWWLGSALLAIAIITNLFFLPGQTTAEQRDSIIQSSTSDQYVPSTPSLPEASGSSDEGTGSGSEE